MIFYPNYPLVGTSIFLPWWSEPTLATWSDGLVYQKNTPPAVRLEPAILRLQIQAFINWAILAPVLRRSEVIIAQWKMNAFHCLSSTWQKFNSRSQWNISRDFSLAFCQSIPHKPMWQKMARSPLNGTIQPVDIEEEKRSPTNWQTELKTVHPRNLKWRFF